jgi:hypothetical protein
MFSAPIPGQSLTSEPKNSAWENPPQMSEKLYCGILEDLITLKKTESVVGLLALGLDLVTMTEGLLRTAVADGRHGIDVSLIIAPVIHEHLKGIAEASGVDYIEGLEEDEEDFDLNLVSVSALKKEAQDILDTIKTGGDVDLSSLNTSESNMEEQEEEMVDIEQQKEKPMGLMSRGIS